MNAHSAAYDRCRLSSGAVTCRRNPASTSAKPIRLRTPGRPGAPAADRDARPRPPVGGQAPGTWGWAGFAGGAEIPPAPLAEPGEDGGREESRREGEEQGGPVVVHHQGAERDRDREHAEAAQHQQTGEPAQQVRRRPPLENRDHHDVAEAVAYANGGYGGTDGDQAAHEGHNGEEERLAQEHEGAQYGGAPRLASLGGNEGTEQSASAERGDEAAVTARAAP